MTTVLVSSALFTSPSDPRETFEIKLFITGETNSRIGNTQTFTNQKQWVLPRVSRESVVNDNGIRPGRGSQDDTLVHTPYLKLENRDWLPCGTDAWMACILLELEGAREFPSQVLHFTEEVIIIQENEGNWPESTQKIRLISEWVVPMLLTPRMLSVLLIQPQETHGCFLQGTFCAPSLISCHSFKVPSLSYFNLF